MTEKHILANGVTLLCEPIEHVKSVSVAVRVEVVPPRDWRGHSGISHFIEHLVFKGTKKRDPRQIARAIDSIGGVLNAWTEHEATTFFVKVLDRHLDIGLDVLSDLVASPLLTKEDVDKERNVILDEILKHTSDPTSYIHDQYLMDAWPNHPAGLPVLGTEKTISRMTSRTVRQYYRQTYVGKNTLVACSGNFDPRLFIEAASEYFGALPQGDGLETPSTSPPEYSPVRAVHPKQFDHINLCLGIEGLPYDTPYRYEYAVLDTVGGGGVSSRLFQEIREKHGICYSISTLPIRMRDAGLFAIHSAAAPANVKRLVQLTMDQLRLLVEEGVSLEETDEAKEQLKGHLMLALESTSARVLRLAAEHVYFGRILSLDEICAGVDAVTQDSLNELARMLFKKSKVGVTIVGNADRAVLDEIDLSVS